MKTFPNWYMATNWLKSRGFKEDHKAMEYGYRGSSEQYCIEEYKGKYGEGFILHCPSWITHTKEFHRINYFIRTSFVSVWLK